MKHIISTSFLVFCSILETSPAQPANPPPPQPAVSQYRTAPAQGIQQVSQFPELPRFDLDFPGGTPQELVDTIKKQIGILNVVIPPEHRNVQLPPLKMNEITVQHLFTALSRSGQNQSNNPYQVPQFIQNRSQQRTSQVSYQFITNDPIVPESVWTFTVEDERPALPGKICRFYQLAPYLTDYKIDDITTAVEAGWKMLGQTPIPELNFHQETKLLIAVGEPNKLELIDSVLNELRKTTKPTVGTSTTNIMPAEPTKQNSKQ